MKIFGIGTDIVNIRRIEQSLKKHKFSFKNKIFSKKEISYCEKRKNSGAFYAKRFAAKEAFSKALGTGIRKGVNLKNIEISNKDLKEHMEKDFAHIHFPYPCRSCDRLAGNAITFFSSRSHRTVAYLWSSSDT